MPYIILLVALLLTACEAPAPQPPAPAPPVEQPVQQPKAPMPPVQDPLNGSMTNMDPRDLNIPKIDVSILLRPDQLAGQITQAVNSMYPNWVLLQHGTYIVFDEQSTIPNMPSKALDMLEQYRPKNEEESFWMYSISNLSNIDGWSVYGNGYGIYTYVYPNELSNPNPSMPDVAAFAKAKRALDEANPKVIYTHTAENGLQAYPN